MKANIECLEAWQRERENRHKPPNKYQRKAIRKRNELIERILTQNNKR